MQITPELAVSIISACAAVTAAIFAFRNSQTARKALALSQQASDARGGSISIYLIEGLRQRMGDSQLFLFAISFINRADSPDSIVRIELEIHYAASNRAI